MVATTLTSRVFRFTPLFERGTATHHFSRLGLIAVRFKDVFQDWLWIMVLLAIFSSLTLHHYYIININIVKHFFKNLFLIMIRQIAEAADGSGADQARLIRWR